MIRSLYVAGSGMQAQQAQMDVIANNLANVNTVGYKRVRATFQDLLYEEVARAPAGAPAGVQVGHGVRLTATQRELAGGILSPASGPYDLAIAGDGFFRLRRSDGSEAYTRDGSFRLDALGRLATARGDLVLGAGGEPVTVPPGVERADVATDGTLTHQDPASGETVIIGRLELVRFRNPSGLLALGDNAFAATAAAGPAEADGPGRGQIRQGFLESSNVEVVNELVSLITAQRTYEINAKALQSADEMLQLVNNLRR